MTKPTATPVKQRRAHIWVREDHDHYCEPRWTIARLLEEEKFEGGIYDPSCGFGNIPRAAHDAGHEAFGSDIVDRGFDNFGRGVMVANFFDVKESPAPNILMNPPFNIAKDFTRHALSLAERKVAIIFPTKCINAIHKWTVDTPLYRIMLMTPRPSMPPGHVIAAGEKPGSGTTDFAWLIWLRGYSGTPTVHWLRRDKPRAGSETKAAVAA